MKAGKKHRRESNKQKTKHVTRREFIQDAGSLLGGTALTSFLLLGACKGQTDQITTNDKTQHSTTPSSDIIYSPDTKRADRIPPGQRETENWPVLQYGSVPQIDNAGWTFTLSGLVENEVTLNHSEFMKLPMVKVFSDIHCVTTWSRLDNLWGGPSSQTIADLAGIKAETGYAIIKAHGGFTTNLTIADFLEEDVLFAVSHDNQPLSPSHGAPVRLVVPRLYFWKSAKWVTGVEFTSNDHPGFWENAGYHNRGDPWLEERRQD
jgi:DMSO/TMAO reductase YedYZ molybdopterin-dependent catalytic subunit